MARTKPTIWDTLTPEDAQFAQAILGSRRGPDLTIADADTQAPYLHRWHIVPRNKRANVYLHVQIADDPERPLHDHPWENTSVILSGGYLEMLQALPWPGGYVREHQRKVGDVIHRQAEQPHRLLLPRGTPYTMTIFSTGPTVRDWGFWCDVNGRLTWMSHKDCVKSLPNGCSVWCGPLS